MSGYEEKRQVKIERFKELAEKNHALAKSKHKEASTISDMIPFGQPILVGHHSEARHRRDAERIHNKHGQGFEAAKKADYYEERAKSAESNRSIFSDDPEAITNSTTDNELSDTIEANERLMYETEPEYEQDVYN